MSRSARGMSLIEVLVAIGIIATLIALLLPATRRVREPAARMQCANNLKILMLATHNCADTTGTPDATAGRALPPGCFGAGATPEEKLSWMVKVLPYMEQEPLAKQFDEQKGYAGNLVPAGVVVKTYFCTSGEAKPVDAVTHYVAISGLGPAAAARPAGADGNGFMGYDRLTATATIRDGTSNTIALMETRAGLGPWARGGASTLRGFDPDDAPAIGDDRPFGGHPGGANVAMADGSVRFLRASLDAQKLAAAITIAGGDPVSLD